jgi:hypothetical protein
MPRDWGASGEPLACAPAAAGPVQRDTATLRRSVKVHPVENINADSTGQNAFLVKIGLADK